MARLYIANPSVPKWWRKVGPKRSIKIAGLVVLMGFLAAGVPRDLTMIMLQVSAFLFGISAGYFGRRPASPVNYTTLLMAAMTIGIALQPEYFRFGQLGRLTIVHLIALGSVIALAATVFALRNFTPTEFIKDNHYKYIKWFMRLACVLAFILFVMTESVLVLAGLAAGMFVLIWLAVKHAPRGSNLNALSMNTWAVMIFMFGVVTSIPTISCVGILCWKNNNVRNFWKNLTDILR